MPDEKVSTQKVFIKLSGVTALAAEWARVEKEIAAARARREDVNALVIRKQALDFALNTLELPRA